MILFIGENYRLSDTEREAGMSGRGDVAGDKLVRVGVGKAKAFEVDGSSFYKTSHFAEERGTLRGDF
jgi:hypothetical protein